ncbi:MAG: serine hydrolase [Sphingorhabdus sp.]
MNIFRMFRSASLIALAVTTSVVAGAQPAPTAPPSPVDPVISIRRHMLDADINAFTFRNMDEMFETRTVSRGGPVWTLPHAPGFAPPTYSFGGQQRSYEEFAARTFTNAFLVIRDGKIIFEDYRNRSTEKTRFISFSMAKSITSLLIGKAVEQGHIRSLDDPASDYVPELKGGGYEGVSIRHILQMRSGVDYEERYDFGETPSMAMLIHENAIVQNKERFADRAKTIGKKTKPGSMFNYATLDTAILGWVLERATKQPVARYMSDNLWKPAGMEADGFWIADGPPGTGRELTGMGYNATLRDFGRLGQLMLQDGMRGNKRVLAKGWMQQATTMLPFPDGGALGLGKGYGFQFWQVDDEPGAYAAVGLAGQFIYVHPKSRTVIVKLSYFPLPEPVDAIPETLAYFKQVVNSQ